MKLSKAGPKTNAGSVRVAQGTYQKALVQKLFTQLLIALMGILVVYVCFAATIVRFIPSDAGFVLTKNNTYPGGELPTNAQALIMLDPAVEVKDGMADRLKQAVIPQKPTAVVEVLAGPIGRVKWGPGAPLQVNGKALPVSFPEDPQIEFLADQYVAVCISGACEPGSGVIFTSTQIMGVPVQQNADTPSAPEPAAKK